MKNKKNKKHELKLDEMNKQRTDYGEMQYHEIRYTLVQI